ncbi:MAG TPA: HTH domain-containing protein [Methanothermococcus okinawensis]|uniref:HTH domain-containing protein n=1 Tax=Methanothermococcus okinawensis TaxID=155863 RepID=A0A832Z7R9_9EURY|nr:HTH domain-containing protein [Methanothermococcus okinawensis]HIP90776.1 HTH domain-containing protein [Methanothermococcus okinawensis]
MEREYDSINLDFWTFLKEAYKRNIKLDLGHFIILMKLLEINREYRDLIEKYGKRDARKILEDKGIFSKNSEYVSGEYLKRFISRSSRGAVYSRIKDLQSLGFEIKTKPGALGGYRLVKTPKWFKLLD